MKIRLNKTIIGFALIAMIIAIAGCQEGYGEADYGFPYIYMPQATVTGGVDSTYTVPTGSSELTFNFIVESGKLNIILGVRRSGKLPDAAFSVDVMTSSEATESAVKRIENAIALPTDIYTLPNKVQVSGDNATFHLSVDANALKNNEAFNEKNLVLAVRIANPDKFELSTTNTCTVVVIDVEAIRELL